MGELALPPTFFAPTVPQALPVPDSHVLAVELPVDPLDCGFLLAGGVLASLPAKVRLPHEEDDPEVD